MSDDTAGNMEAAEKEASAQRIRGLEARIAELEKGDIKSRREIVRLQRAVEQEKTVANVKANQYAARTLAQRERDNYLKLLLNNSSDIILFLNKTKRIAFCTDAFVRQTHFADAGAVSGKLLQDVFSEFQDESWFAELLKHAEETVKSGMTSSFEGDIDFGGKGERRRYMIGFTSMNNESGENEGLMILFYDVTAIARAREAAEAASKSKSVFLSNMSHEIRTPMNAIIGMADLMRTDNLDETQREYLAGIRKTSGALLDIINDILDFSKIEAGKMELVQTNYNLFALFDNIRSIAELFAAGKSLRLECDIDETLPRVLYGDEGRVRQVIMNLVSNAVKYTRKGQVCLRLRRTTKNERGYLSVSVEDTGIGIKKEDFPRLFESFEQVDKDKNRGITGTGLGLPITKRLTDLMGGEIFIESEYGKGSVFTILLPLDEGDPLKAEISKGRKRCRVSQDIRILVVDDNALNLTVAQGFLARHGVRAETAESGEEAIEKVCTASYDLVFMDHMMPGMDGIETVHRIRALPGAYYADLPIVALSANAVLELRDLFFQAGMNGFIAKPIDADELNAALIRWLPPEKILAEEEEDATAERVDDDSPAGGEYDEMLLRLRDIDDLDIAAGLARTAGDKRTYTDILCRFCAGLDRDIDDIRAFMEKGEWKDYSIRLHSLKSVFANFGNRRMTERAFALESASANGDTAACLQGTPGFCGEMEAFRAELLAAGLGKSGGSVPKTRIGDGELALKLETLERACLGGNADEAGRTADELRRVTRDAATDALIMKISDLAEAFDYGEAAAECGKLIATLGGTGAD